MVILTVGGCKEVKAPESLKRIGSVPSDTILPFDTIASEFKLPDEAKAKAREYVTNNTYIDFDIKALSQKLAAGGVSTISTDTLAMMQAAVYRFWSSVTVKDNLYVVEISSPEAINLSKRVYDDILANIITMNAWLLQDKFKGEDVTVEPITKEYLESLLN